MSAHFTLFIWFQHFIFCLKSYRINALSIVVTIPMNRLIFQQNTCGQKKEIGANIGK